tara:strand:- start:3459 stop:9152 length:5694 start_codon:yes stop_codon:yes gene_type:complete
MSFDLFGPATKCDIRVGYISTDRGYVPSVGVHDANQYAKLNPGTTFIFTNRDKVQYLNINEVNRLQPDDLLPSNHAGEGGGCVGITGLNPEGDNSKDIKGKSITDNTGATLELDTTRVNFYGGGGVGVQANPIVGKDGSLLAVDVVHGGFGYQYPPIVDISDDRGVGSGVVAQALVKTGTGGTDYYVQEYDQEDDFEEYVLDKCVPISETAGYGKRYGVDGKELGDWDPSLYIGKNKDPMLAQIKKYQDLLSSLQGGSKIDKRGDKILQWWSTRKNTPLRVISPDKTTRKVYDVFHWAWGSKPGTNDEIANLYIELFGRDPDPRGHEFWRKQRDSGKSLGEIKEAMKTFPEWEEVCRGKCKPVMPDKTYKFGTYWEYDKDNFMNSNAISPVPSSNAKGTDFAGKTYTMEWEEDFPFEGEYRFRVQADNDARLYIDNAPVTDIRIGGGGAAGSVLSEPLDITKHLSPGVHRVAISLLNHPKKEKKKVSKPLPVPVNATSTDVTFKVTSAANYANGINIDGLFDVEKTYKGPQLNETITKEVEYNKPYNVQLRSAGKGKFKGKGIAFTGLNSANNPINVTNNGKRLSLKDGDGDDINASFTIDSGNVKFSADGKSIEGSGKATFTLSWSDNPRTAGQAVGSIKIGNKTWTQSGRSGTKTQTVTIDDAKTGSLDAAIQLRTKGEQVLQMEEWTDNDWSDIVCSASVGKFYNIRGNTAKFIVNSPPQKSPSTGNDRAKHVFNTVDWISKANRPLWKINPGAGKDAGFLSRFGVLPFDPTNVGKVDNQRSRELLVVGPPPTVKFMQEDGKNYLKVVGTGKVKVFFELNVNDRPGISSLALTEIKIKADEGNIILKRDPNRRYARETGSGTFTAGQKYLVKTIGASRGAGSRISVDKTTIGYDDDYGNGYDENGNLKINAVTPISSTETNTYTTRGFPDYPNASTDDYAGVHEIIWNNISFPADGNYSIEIMVDDNVVLTFSRPGRPDTIIRKDGFSVRGDGSTATGKSVEMKFFKEGSYTLKAELEQIPGKPLAKGNQMALAVDIKAAFVVDDVEVISVQSWNQNPMGIAMTIDAPMPTIPQEIPKAEGRCPNNPIWSTRHPNANQKWYPVRVDFWGKFMNRYAMSPIAPLAFKGTDGTGTSYFNEWNVNLPYSGFYGVKGTVDNDGRILIDGQEVLGPSGSKIISKSKSKSPNMVKKYLEGGSHTIRVEVENDQQFTMVKIDKKIFSTADWASKQTQTQKTVEESNTVEVTFKVTSAAVYANNIDMRGVFSVGKEYGGPNINETYSRNIEAGKEYDVVFTSNNKAQKTTNIPIVYKGLNAANNPINVSNGGKVVKLKDGSGNDANATITIDKTDGGRVSFTNDGKGFKVTGGTAAKRVLTTITLTWNDNPGTAGVAIDSFSVGDKTWTRTGRSGTVQKSVYIYPPNADNNQNNNSNIQLRNKGKNVVQMEEWTDNDWSDIVCSASEGEFYNMTGNTCKFRVPSNKKVETVYGKGLVSGSAKDGVTYSGPSLATYASGELGPYITPTWNTDEEYKQTHNGTTWIMTWENVDFPETGTYTISALADDELIVKIDGVEITKAQVKKGLQKHLFNLTKGKRKVELTLMNLDFNAPFSANPAVAAVKITKKTNVPRSDPSTGKALGKPWTVNPIGVAAILIPPPCPKKISGVGIVTDVVIADPGNGLTPPIKPGDSTPSYPVNLELQEIIPVDTGGINYGKGDLVCVKNTETGEERCFEPEFGPFGQITGVIIPPYGGADGPVIPPWNGFTSTPLIRVKSKGLDNKGKPKVPTGIGAQFIPKFKIVRDPIGIPTPDQLLQVTDLVGLKRTGFYDGKPYYGAVFYKDGIKYAGWYETPGKLVQIYDTMQESIDAEVTTSPSAILRQGSDTGGNNPGLNIPGTPNNLT